MKVGDKYVCVENWISGNQIYNKIGDEAIVTELDGSTVILDSYGWYDISLLNYYWEKLETEEKFNLEFQGKCIIGC